ncbi:MAG: 1-deoxy-D-xylulose-5-phosphate synthase [Thermodesulfobacteriota bacterium]
MQKNNQETILDKLTTAGDIKELTLQQLEVLARELREEIIYTVSCNGGHLAPSLGVVELTLALMYNFDPEKDKIIWDVGHQSYAYKILTLGVEKFRTIRTFGGIPGFPNPGFSKMEHFGVGHSSTSISAGLGMAVARDLSETDNYVLSIIGDGSMTAGLAYEGLNQAGDQDRNLVVILNDNEMSISNNVGALSSFFSRKLYDQRFVRFKEDLKRRLRQVPRIGEELVNYARRSEDSLKSFFTPGMLFEAFKFNYLGPINGHSLKSLIDVFKQVQTLEGPILIHTATIKGKGFPPAEEHPTHFHGVGCFEPKTGEPAVSKVLSEESYGEAYNAVFGKTMCKLAEEDSKIVAITAAMPEGTGLATFKERYPDRFFDVGICEQHAVTFAAGLASQGYRPVVSIYSTFMQRSYDQIVHDVCLQNLPVTFCLDRAGLVGEDGPTHHGAFDISYLRHIPNLVLMAPKDELELQSMLALGVEHTGPCAIRYPKGSGPGSGGQSNATPLSLGKGESMKSGSDLLLIALGSTVPLALEAANELEQRGVASISLFNARFVKPLPEEQLLQLIPAFEKILIIEENSVLGGFSSAITELLADRDLLGSNIKIRRMGLPDRFIEHGSRSQLLHTVKLDKEGIKQEMQQLLKS